MAGPAAFLDLLARAELRSAAGDWAEAAGLWTLVTAANPVHGASVQQAPRIRHGCRAHVAGTT